MRLLLQLFLSFFQIGAFSFGGGYAAMPLIEWQIVNLHNWLNSVDFNNLISISQMTPGPIAINSATFVGVKIAGIPGALVATFGCIIPSCIIVMAITVFYTKHKDLAVIQGVLRVLRPAIVAMIASSGVSILLSAVYVKYALQLDLVVIFVVSFILLKKYKLDPILAMVIAGVMKLITAYIVTLL